MRIRTVVTLASLLLPGALSAQRIPLPGITRRGPARPADLPPQPEPIARQLAYRRWRLSVESYPMVSWVQAPGMTGVRAQSSFTTFGTGTRADYLLTRNMSATLDLTSSYLGGPAITSTAELGTRLHPEWAEHRLFPFVDLRVGYIMAFDRGLGSYDQFPYTYSTPELGYVVRYSRGFGAIGGAGLEYSLTRSWSITTGASVLRSAMTGRDFDIATDAPHFAMTSVRYTLGVRYNPVRFTQGPGTDIR